LTGIDTYDRHAEKLRQELTLLRMDRVQASLEQRQRFQQLFFPDGIGFDGNGFIRTAVTFASRVGKEGLPAVARWHGGNGSAFVALPLWRTSFACIQERRMVDLNSASWNRIQVWLRRLRELQTLAAR
jgi:hypothetical protein